MSRRSFILILIVTVLVPIATGQKPEPWFFAVLADPQLGMYAKDRNFVQESANLEFVVATLNRLHPRFVVVCGDLVNRTADGAEISEYKRILHELDPTIAVYNVAGNHDVGNTPTPATLKGYRQTIGPDYYTFSTGGILGIVLDSSLIAAPGLVSHEALRQQQWLENTLKAAQLHPNTPIVVFQHIPYFLHDAMEKDDYFNVPAPARRLYLDVLEKAQVRYVFAGHYHRNAGGSEGSLTETVTGTVGLPIGESLSGLRIVTVNGSTLDSRWYCLGDIPNQVQAPILPPTQCPQ